MSRLSRRDFLKLTAATSAGVLLPRTLTEATASWRAAKRNQRPNVLILLFDSMSARHLSLYGYPRETTPHLTRFAERAIVYHAHVSAGNYTTPATASLLTGLYPWTHRLREAFVRSLLPWWGGTLPLAAGLLWLTSKVNWMRRSVLELSDRMLVFLYIFIPLSLLSLVVVLVRNLA